MECAHELLVLRVIYLYLEHRLLLLCQVRRHLALQRVDVVLSRLHVSTGTGHFFVGSKLVAQQSAGGSCRLLALSVGEPLLCLLQLASRLLRLLLCFDAGRHLTAKVFYLLGALVLCLLVGGVFVYVVGIAKGIPQPLLGRQQLLLIVRVRLRAIVELHLRQLDTLRIVMLRTRHLFRRLLHRVRAAGLGGIGWCDRIRCPSLWRCLWWCAKNIIGFLVVFVAQVLPRLQVGFCLLSQSLGDGVITT